MHGPMALAASFRASHDTCTVVLFFLVADGGEWRSKACRLALA